MRFQALVRKKSVAVVGNASSLFDKEYGELIDSHDVVIRFNKTAIFYEDLNCEKTHGKKINMWAFVSKRAFENSVLKKEDNIKTIEKKFYENNGIIKIYTKFSGSNESGSITFPNRYVSNLKIDMSSNIIKSVSRTSAENELVLKNLYRYDCTTGLMVLYWLCNSDPSKVSIFGFDFKKTPTFSEVHRHDEIQNRIDTRCNHNYEVEEMYVKSMMLKRNKNFRLYE